MPSRSTHSGAADSEPIEVPKVNGAIGSAQGTGETNGLLIDAHTDKLNARPIMRGDGLSFTRLPCFQPNAL
jgi:hypothetical protein